MRPTVYYKPAPGSQQRKPLRGGASLLVRKPRARKQEWNNYLTDNQYSLSKEEVERRKKLFESKNNVLSENYAPPPPLLKPKKRKATPKPQLAENNELTSLDLLDLSSQTDELPRDVRRETDRPAAVVWTPSKPRSAASSSSPSSSSPSAASPSPPTHSARGTSPQKARKPTAVLQSPRAAPAMVPSREHSGLSAKDSTPRKLASQAADPSEALSDQDLHEMNAEIVVLFEELRAYESMTGKTSSIPSAQLQEMYDMASGAGLSQKKVMRFLVQLVCQTLTCLLEKEVEHSELRSRIQLLSAALPEEDDRMPSFFDASSAAGATPATTSTPATATRSVAAILSTPTRPSVLPDLRLTETPLPATASHSARPMAATEMTHDSEAMQAVLDHAPHDEDTENELTKSLEEMENIIAHTRQVGATLSPAVLAFTKPSLMMGRVDLGTAPAIASTPLGSAQAAGLELRAHKQALDAQIAEFSGTSATDLLFLTPTTPHATYSGVLAAAERANQTFDLYSQSFHQPRAVTTRNDLTDSYEDMIDRLSSKFTAMHTYGARNHPTQSEQPSMVMPLPQPPTPVAKSVNPLAQTVRMENGQVRLKSGKKVEAHFVTNKELFPPTPERDPRVFDATNGSYLLCHKRLGTNLSLSLFAATVASDVEAAK